LYRVSADVAHGKAAFWQARDVQHGLQALQAIDRSAVLLPLAQANLQLMPGTLGAQGDIAAQRTRVLRDALHQVLHRLQTGQVLLATVGSTAPFVGLLGPVWGIYHALTGIATAGQLTIERVAGPVGEALVMTAAGLAVALPAVLAFNVMGRVINRLEQELEGFAYDLREL
jgi:biopolymer transport protein ExbB